MNMLSIRMFNNYFYNKMSQYPILPVEEIYTDADISKDILHDKRLGYTFDYPRGWLDSNSENKMIGVRRLKLIPT